MHEVGSFLYLSSSFSSSLSPLSSSSIPYLKLQLSFMKGHACQLPPPFFSSSLSLPSSLPPSLPLPLPSSPSLCDVIFGHPLSGFFETWQRHFALACLPSCQAASRATGLLNHLPKSRLLDTTDQANLELPVLVSCLLVISFHISRPIGHSRELAWKSRVPSPLDELCNLFKLTPCCTG